MATPNQYVMFNNISPLNTSQYPSIVSNLNNSVLNGAKPNPSKFYPSDNGSLFSSGRNTYLRTNNTQNTNAYVPNNKYNAPLSASAVISRNKNNAIGKSSLKFGLGNDQSLSYKNNNKNTVSSALRRVRSSGYVVPPKVTAIYK